MTCQAIALQIKPGGTVQVGQPVFVVYTMTMERRTVAGKGANAGELRGTISRQVVRGKIPVALFVQDDDFMSSS